MGKQRDTLIRIAEEQGHAKILLWIAQFSSEADCDQFLNMIEENLGYVIERYE